MSNTAHTLERPTNAGTTDGRSKKRPGIDSQRAVILDAAVELFAKQGSRAVSISQLCTAAGVSRPTFYKCFEDKHALINALYNESINEPVQAILLASLGQEKANRQSIEDALCLLIDTIFEHERIAELMFVESSDPASPAFTIIDNAFDKAADALLKAMAKSKKTKPSRVYLKANMVAAQWIVHNAIQKGLTPHNRREAKTAVLELSNNMFARQP